MLGLENGKEVINSKATAEEEHTGLGSCLNHGGRGKWLEELTIGSSMADLRNRSQEQRLVGRGKNPR